MIEVPATQHVVYTYLKEKDVAPIAAKDRLNQHYIKS